MSKYDTNLIAEGQTRLPGTFTTGYRLDLATAREIIRARRESSGTPRKPKPNGSGNH